MCKHSAFFSCLSGFRPDFAVADAATDFHIWPGCCDGAGCAENYSLVNARGNCKGAIVDASLAERCSRDALPLRKLADAPNFSKLLC